MRKIYDYTTIVLGTIVSIAAGIMVARILLQLI